MAGGQQRSRAARAAHSRGRRGKGELPPLWRCPKCGERFVTRNLWHSCGKFSLRALFAGCEPQVFAAFRKFRKMMRACGPVRMIPQKSRIVFQVRVRYGGCIPRKSFLLCGLALPRRVRDKRFSEIIEYGPHFIAHRFRVRRPEDLDARVQRWMREAYTVGQQKHLRR